MEIPSQKQCHICESAVELHELRPCSSCRNPKGEPQWYCIRFCRFCRRRDCGTEGHTTCWRRHLPPEKSEDHRAVDPVPGLFVDAATYSECDKDRQEKLHEDDRIAQWFTIKSDFAARTASRLWVTDRFRQLCNPGYSDNRWSSKQYPGFVSFIGSTGIGKSSIVRAMVLMGRIEMPFSELAGQASTDEVARRIAGIKQVLAVKACGPVARSAANEHMTFPTSFGVHLYRDQAVSLANHDGQDTPMLFADCEGFRAGTAMTNAERIGATPPRLVSDLPITAAYTVTGGKSDKGESRDGKDGIDLFYARFLYTISDVVVFVMNSDTELYPTMQRLVEWAASAVHRSVNHLAQKTLIIVRNMATIHREDLYDSGELKRSLIDNLPNLWEGSDTLEELRKEFNKKQPTNAHRIQDNAGLLGVFFSDVQVCYIPDKAKAPSQEIFDQYRKLRGQIVEASQESQRLRSFAWMQYNVPTLSHILNRAFEHFRTSDNPFDFYHAARNDNPSPASVSNHIANFLRHLHLTSSFPPNMISEVVSTCFVTWALRTRSVVGDPRIIFSRELDSECSEGLEEFRTRDQRCGFRSDKLERCVNRRMAHPEHVDDKNNRAPGSFDDSLELSPDTLLWVKDLFTEKCEKLCTSEFSRTFNLPDPKKLRLFREDVVQKYGPCWEMMKSNVPD